jgi:2-oxoglutarate dehydrogenase E1 component
MWEAQFGDFNNVAQSIIDQYITASEDKWKQTSRLTMLLPHGYEGQGPEHSSARLERFLQLCAANNICVCYPTTPAQYFHLLRRQVREAFERPIVMHQEPATTSGGQFCLDQLANGGFQPLIDDSKSLMQTQSDASSSAAARCFMFGEARKKSVSEPRQDRRARSHHPRRAVLSLPNQRLSPLTKYQNAKDLVWCQENQNMGGWTFTEIRGHGS